MDYDRTLQKDKAKQLEYARYSPSRDDHNGRDTHVVDLRRDGQIYPIFVQRSFEPRTIQELHIY